MCWRELCCSQDDIWHARHTSTHFQECFTTQVKEIREKAVILAKQSTSRARNEGQNLLGGGAVDIIISTDGTGKKQEFLSSLWCSPSHCK